MNDEQDTLYVSRPQEHVEVVRGPRVVAAVDGSAGSRAALQFALEDAARRGVPVEVVIAYRPPDYWMDFNGVGAAEEERLLGTLRSQHEERARSVVDEVLREWQGPVPEVHVRAAMGPAAGVLTRMSEGADLLVIGSRGHGGFHTMLLGSTSMQCAMHATCPVTVVHSPEARRHRLRLHRDRHEEDQGERRRRWGSDRHTTRDDLAEAASLR